MNPDLLLTDLDDIADGLEAAILTEVEILLQGLLLRIEELLSQMPQDGIESELAYRWTVRPAIEEAMIDLNDYLYELTVVRLAEATPAIRAVLGAFRTLVANPPVDLQQLADGVYVLALPLSELFRRRSPSPFMEMLLRVVDRKVAQERMRPEPRGFGPLVYGRTGPRQRPNPRDLSTIQSGFRKVLQANTASAVWSAISFQSAQVWGDTSRLQWRWVTRRDELVCAVCRPLDGEVFFNFADAPAWPAHPRCVTSDTPVRVGTVVAAYRARYCGGLVTIGTKAGRRLTVTPKHPVLTSLGWVAAGQLKEGQHLLSDSPRLPSGGDLPHFDQPPALAEDVFDAVRASSSVAPSRVPATSVQFHGDELALKGDVEVVFPQWVLQARLVAQAGENLLEFERVVADVDLRNKPAPSLVDLLFVGHNAASCGLMGLANESYTAFRGQLAPAERHGITTPAWLNPVLAEAVCDDDSTDSETFRQRFDTLTTLVEPDEVLKVEFNPPGHEPVWVYDFTTLSHIYTAGGVVVHNCRCVLLPEDAL